MEDCIGGFSSYTKGVPQKLYAFDKFLETHAGWREKTVLIQVAVPTRSNVGEYQKLRREVNELIENGNGKHSMDVPCRPTDFNLTNLGRHHELYPHSFHA